MTSVPGMLLRIHLFVLLRMKMTDSDADLHNITGVLF